MRDALRSSAELNDVSFRSPAIATLSLFSFSQSKNSNSTEQTKVKEPREPGTNENESWEKVEKRREEGNRVVLVFRLFYFGSEPLPAGYLRTFPFEIFRSKRASDPILF
jgi:hypothetical protein